MTYTGEPPYLQPGGEPAADNVTSLANEVLAIVALHIPQAAAADHADAAAVPAAAPRRKPYLRLLENIA